MPPTADKTNKSSNNKLTTTTTTTNINNCIADMLQQPINNINATQTITMPQIRKHKLTKKRTKDFATNSFLLPHQQQIRQFEVIAEEEEEHAIDADSDENHSLRSSAELGSNNLLVTFDYGYSDSLEAVHLSAEVDEHTTFIIAEKMPAVTVVDDVDDDDDDWYETIVQPYAERICYAKMQENANGSCDDVAKAFPVHRMQHNTTELIYDDSTMMSFASYASSYSASDFDALT